MSPSTVSGSFTNNQIANTTTNTNNRVVHIKTRKIESERTLPITALFELSLAVLQKDYFTTTLEQIRRVTVSFLRSAKIDERVSQRLISGMRKLAV